MTLTSANWTQPGVDLDLDPWGYLGCDSSVIKASWNLLSRHWGKLGCQNHNPHFVIDIYIQSLNIIAFLLQTK